MHRGGAVRQDDRAAVSDEAGRWLQEDNRFVRPFARHCGLRNMIGVIQPNGDDLAWRDRRQEADIGQRPNVFTRQKLAE